MSYYLTDIFSQEEISFNLKHSNKYFNEEFVKTYQNLNIDFLLELEEYLAYRLLTNERNYSNNNIITENRLSECRKKSTFLSAVLLSCSSVRGQEQEVKAFIKSLSNLEKYGYIRKEDEVTLELLLGASHEEIGLNFIEHKNLILSHLSYVKHNMYNNMNRYVPRRGYNSWAATAKWEIDTNIPSLVFEVYKPDDYTRCEIFNFYHEKLNNFGEKHERLFRAIFDSTLNDIEKAPNLIDLGLRSPHEYIQKLALQRKEFYEDPNFEDKRNWYFECVYGDNKENIYQILQHVRKFKREIESLVNTQ